MADRLFYGPRRTKWTLALNTVRFTQTSDDHPVASYRGAGPGSWSIYWEAPLVYAISQVHAGIPADDLVSSSMQVPPATHRTLVRLSRPE